MSNYQTFKIILVDYAHISKDAFHIIAGFIVFLIFARLFKISLNSFKSLVAPIVFSVLLEILDIRDSITYGDALDIYGSVKDIIVTIFLPLLTVLFIRLKKIGV